MALPWSFSDVETAFGLFVLSDVVAKGAVALIAIGLGSLVVSKVIRAFLK